MDERPTWTDCDEAGDYVVPNVLSPRDLVFRLDNMDETVPHTHNCDHDCDSNRTTQTLHHPLYNETEENSALPILNFEDLKTFEDGTIFGEAQAPSATTT